MASDGMLDFIAYNDLEDVLHQKYKDIDEVRREYPNIVQLFKNSTFPAGRWSRAWPRPWTTSASVPLIVRSSSLLEDRVGTAFSGKYKSLFLANQGTKQRAPRPPCWTPSPRSTPRSSAPTPSSTGASAGCSTSTRRWAS